MRPAVFEGIDWKLHGKILSMVAPGYRPGIQKILWNEHPTTVKMLRDGRVENDRCPLCQEVDGPGHFLQCSVIGKDKERERIIGNLKTKMRERGTNPFLAGWVLEVLKGQMPKLERMQPLRLSWRVETQFERQVRIGWGNMMDGRM